MQTQKTIHLPLKLLGITFIAYWFAYFAIDQLIASFVHNYVPTSVQDLSAIVSFPAETAFWIIAAIAVWLALHFFYDSLKDKLPIDCKHINFIAASIITSGIVCEVLKIMLGRSRPELWLNHDIYGFHLLSFADALHSTPSGHTTIAFVLATIVSILRPKWQVLGWILASLVALSRILLNQHFVSDTLLGAYLGWLITFLIANYLYSRI